MIHILLQGERTNHVSQRDVRAVPEDALNFSHRGYSQHYSLQDMGQIRFAHCVIGRDMRLSVS